MILAAVKWRISTLRSSQMEGEGKHNVHSNQSFKSEPFIVVTVIFINLNVFYSK